MKMRSEKQLILKSSPSKIYAALRATHHANAQADWPLAHNAREKKPANTTSRRLRRAESPVSAAGTSQLLVMVTPVVADEPVGHRRHPLSDGGVPL